MCSTLECVHSNSLSVRVYIVYTASSYTHKLISGSNKVPQCLPWVLLLLPLLLGVEVPLTPLTLYILWVVEALTTLAQAWSEREGAVCAKTNLEIMYMFFFKGQRGFIEKRHAPA